MFGARVRLEADTGSRNGAFGFLARWERRLRGPGVFIAGARATALAYRHALLTLE